MDPAKTTAISTWPTPCNQHNHLSFLGLSNYYCCFIESYTAGTLAGTGSPVCQSSFDSLKMALTQAQTLTPYDPDVALKVLVTDASKFALGGVKSNSCFLL